MMKKLLIAALIASAFTTGMATANELSERSLVKRAYTLKNGEIQVGAALGYGETDDENHWQFNAGARYGLTDDLTIGLGDIRYRALSRAENGNGLELTIGGGLKGYMERLNLDGDDEVLGYGLDIAGKYVMSDRVALTFGTEYVFWNDIGSDNRKEFRYSVGGLYEPIRNVTLMASYTYRDLEDFTQSSAYDISAGVNYSLNKRTDIGLAFGYSDFDAVENGFKPEYAHKRSVGAYVSYRF